MKNIYRAVVLLLLLAAFLVTFMFVTSNRDLVVLDLLVVEWQASLGVLVISLLAVGLVLGLFAGLGLRGVKGLFS